MKKLKAFGKATIETLVFCVVSFSVIAGIISLSSNTSATQSVITVKPTLPKVVITKGFHSYYNIQDEVVEHIRANTKQGYVVKSVSMTEGGTKGWQRAVVVMEKY